MSEIRTYTTAELTDPQRPAPPGWRQPGSLPSILATLGESYGWTPVLSVSLFRDHPEEPGEIQTLTGIRGASTTHQDVVSTPTSTFPTETLPLLVSKRRGLFIGEYPRVAIGRNGPNSLETATVATYWPQLEEVPDTMRLVPYYCHDVLARKLGRPDLISMSSDEELGTVSLARMTLGVSYVGENKRQESCYERLLTVGLVFMLHPHQSHMFDDDIQKKMSAIPLSERRYSSLGWTDVRPFPEAVRLKNGIQLAPYVPEGERVTVCVRGQCLAMTSELISSDYEMLLRHLGRSALDPLDTEYTLGDPEGINKQRKLL